MNQKVNLLCFPFSGGTSSIYLSWFKCLDPKIQLCPIELAGRNKRFNEPLITSLKETIEDLLNQVIPLTASPYALFGHSFGSLIIYELMRVLSEKAVSSPKHIFLSGGIPPHFRKENTCYHKLSKECFLKKLTELGGLSSAFLENQELQDIFLPIIRADYQMYETYMPTEEIFPFPCDLTVFAADQDEIASPIIAEDWSLYTHKEFKLEVFQGNHFFLQKHGLSISQALTQTLSKYL